MKKIEFSRTVPKILEKIVKSEDYQDLLSYENRLVGAFIAPILVIGSLVNFFVRLGWGDPIVDILIVSILFMFCGIGIELIVRSNWNLKMQTHLLSIDLLIVLFTIVVAYYARIGVFVWTIVFLLLFVAISRVDRIMLLYLGGASPIIVIYLSIFHLDQYQKLNLLYYVLQFIMMSLIFVFSLASNKLYGEIIKKNFKRNSELHYQKEEISSLYEEVTASEEELREQNQQLMEYHVQLKENEAHLHKLAYSDSLTGLPNRKKIVETIDQLSIENHSNSAIVFIDLDGFKKVNDTLGHYLGDQLLYQVAKRLQQRMKEKDILARLGGDEFALLVYNYVSKEELVEYLETFCNCLQEAFRIFNHKISVSASFGVAIYPSDATDTDELLQAADTAMYKAKELGKNKIFFYEKALKDELLYRVDLENRLTKALAKNEFRIVYQPQYLITENSLKVRGFEALIRWKIGPHNYMNPLDFIPLTEEIGIIHQIGEWIIRQACKKQKEIKSETNQDVIIGINVSAVQIRNSDFPKIVKKILTEENMPAKWVEIEITESIFIENMKKAVSSLEELRDFGVRIALDDFGTGYSSLSYLKKLPIDLLKIDKSFIEDIGNEVEEKSLIPSIISLVHNLDIEVIAEGVEKKEQLKFLKIQGCDMVQGYYMSRPIRGEKVCRYINEVLEDNIPYTEI